MAHAPTIAMALASSVPSDHPPSAYIAKNATVDHFGREKDVGALLTPPNSISPDLRAHGDNHQSPPPMDIERDMDTGSAVEQASVTENALGRHPAGTPLSKGALSGLDAAAAITPGMLAKYHLPGLLLGNGPRPIRFVMGELTQSVPGFSRIPPAKARRLVVAALEGRNGGGLAGEVTFLKTGWGRWDAHVKGSPRDSGIGSFNDGHFSPPRSERSSYAVSHGDSGINIPGPRLPSGYRDQHSGASYTASSIREQDELDMDMDVPENEADKMSMDGSSDDNSEDFDDDTDDDKNWASVGPEALRKASLPTPGAPRRNYNAISANYSRRWPSTTWSRRPSAVSDRPVYSTSLPLNGMLNAASATPDEHAAAAALMSMGSM